MEQLHSYDVTANKGGSFMINYGSETEQQYWNSWFYKKDSEAANELMRMYMHVVDYHTQRISAHLPSSVSRDDVRSFGYTGLYDALQKFEPSRDFKFETYASFRVRGAIMDGLRKEDWLPRTVRDKVKKIEAAASKLEQSLERKPTSIEIAKQTGLSREEVEEAVCDALFSNVLSMDDKPARPKQDKQDTSYVLPDLKTPQPEDAVLQKELVLQLTDSIKQLNEHEQLVVSLFYKEELTFTEIGHILELTTSRISQIHKRAIFKLRESLAKLSATS
ncbi:RNA polymerase, sigma 28 subunit, SigD/FliA/WhiG [Terribacillus saccharophilus]|uniref:RNA polymerase, sigma 28 subunit, SigD/FliA/WhiG n=2 Tax=Terribacillus saccharophilus TaxID=361277 RepID=A0AAX2ECP7_9BACI|nr:RNA polymerase, sigma 28 subunit, SigD/FliA/WhiG [Terribacillus saccharophilus]